MGGKEGGCPILADERPRGRNLAKESPLFAPGGGGRRQALAGKEINETIAHTYNLQFQLAAKMLRQMTNEGGCRGHLEKAKIATGAKLN